MAVPKVTGTCKIGEAIMILNGPQRVSDKWRKKGGAKNSRVINWGQKSLCPLLKGLLNGQLGL